MTLTPHLLYTGGYAPADQPGIHRFAFDSDSGALAARGTLAGIANPSFLVLHPTGPWLYTVSETAQAPDGVAGAVWAVRLTEEPDGFEPINTQPSGGDWPCHLVIDPSGRWLVVSNYGSGSVGVLPIGADGALGAPADLVQHTGSGPQADRQEGPHAHSAIFSPDGRFVFVADLGIDALVRYTFDPAAGRLLAPTQTRTRPGAGPRHMAFHPGGGALYVANELASTVAWYTYDLADGTLREQQVEETLPPGAPENWVADIHLTPAGDRLYVSNRGHDSLAVFAVAADGRLTRVGVPSCGGAWPRNFALAPGGRFVLAANQHSDAVTVLPVEAGPDALGAPVGQAAVSGAACIQFAAGAG
jgi:6-phosphogluconolactonase